MRLEDSFIPQETPVKKNDLSTKNFVFDVAKNKFLEKNEKPHTKTSLITVSMVNGETVQTFENLLHISKGHRKNLWKRFNNKEYTVEGDKNSWVREDWGYPKDRAVSSKNTQPDQQKKNSSSKNVSSDTPNNVVFHGASEYEDPKPTRVIYSAFSKEAISFYSLPVLDFFRLYRNKCYYEEESLLIFPPKEGDSRKRGFRKEAFLRLQIPSGSLRKESPDLLPEMLLFERAIPFTPEICSSLPKRCDPESIQNYIEEKVESTVKRIKLIMGNPNADTSESNAVENLAKELLNITKKLELMQKRLESGTLHFLGHEPWRFIPKANKIMAIRAALQSKKTTIF
ncbi:Oidioi.mRNA.OKI2018_I69.chr2.g4338.t1.cds [Oikopleura dioica]|uniref:Oidioi.mRNA.OKI2018_I69.chr2.g4338.t1.cds n=1 Tax=Oikopleura dioica TaxID=34765 RepID=A0ABN7SX24_OIKDI|nr:Oidioi.mRNA.OKI2018_I69.chr2.g4338.t1.cds [Oikopleura dioica]